MMALAGSLSLAVRWLVPASYSQVAMERIRRYNIAVCWLFSTSVS